MHLSRHLSGLAVVCAGLTFVSPSHAQILNEPLNGSTTGFRSGGTFVAGGWRVDNEYDCIYWHVPTVAHGAFEFDIVGLPDGNCPGSGTNSKNEISHMYDNTVGGADVNYNGGYRDDTYKQFLRKQCVTKNNQMEILWDITPNFLEDDTPALSWDGSTVYHFRNEWENAGGNSTMNTYRNGVLIWHQVLPGSWNPAGQSIRIAASPRRGDEGAAVGSIYSNVMYWDLTAAIPNAPTITSPANAETINTTIAFVQWTGDSHTQYQVRVNAANDPNAAIVYDSQLTTSDLSYAWSGTLSNNANYYVFARLASAAGTGAWSTGRAFTVNTAFVPSGPNIVRVKGTTLCDNNGPFLGVGATYMRALQRCKYDRPRFQSDCQTLAAKGFNYFRELTMVSWCGLEIAPLSYANPGACGGGTIAAWPDYWQQFTDCIDIAYSYGLRVEVTVFAGAQDCMPNKTDRFAHLDGILARMPGREHKVILIEVANENYANGVSDADVREFGAYLAARTSIPVALTSPGDTSDPGIIGMYSSSAADIATVHFSRDTGTVEGGWLPVRDCYHAAHLPGVPPVSSNEPIGAGSSVSTELDPVKLGAAAYFAYIANLPMYVYHSRAGVYGWSGCCPISGTERPFETSEGINSYLYVRTLLPPDVSSWVRNDGLESAAPFTTYCMGQANQYWPNVGGATNGCDRHISAIKSGRFVTFPMGILSGGLTLQARRPMQFKVYNLLTGAIAYNLTKNANDQFTLDQGPGAYVIIGDFTDVPIDGGGGAGPGILNVKPAGTITVDGNPSDWALTDFVTKSRGGQGKQGDIALVGFDGDATVYRGAYVGVLPTNAADHTAKIYSRQNATYLYFLARIDDNQIQTQNGVAMNWANDCVEFYIDPGNAGGSAPINNSTSAVQLVIDAANQKNVYMCTSGYTTQVLNGVTSAVTTDATGWWLEVRIQKNALSPAIPANSGVFGLDFNFRDNDNANDPALTTVYTWSENSTAGFPSKIPSHWGKGQMRSPFGGTAHNIPGTIQAEDFDLGGEGITYHDNEVANQGGQYRTSEGVDIEVCPDTGGGYNLGYIYSGEWLEYTVNVVQTGDYAIKFRMSSATSGGSFHLSLDGVPITAVKTMAGTGGWQNYTTIIVPGVFLSAGNNRILRFSVDNPDIGFNFNYIDFVYGGADVVSEDLDISNTNDGMAFPGGGDGNTTPVSIGGHNCRRNTNPASDFYMYFSITDIYAFQGNNSATITMDYYDTGSGSLTLQYDGNSSAYTNGSSVTLTNTNTWKTAVYTVTDGYFGNRQNSSADFRISAPVGATFYIDTVMVYSTPTGLPAPGQAGNPNPANGATGVSNTATLSWTAGSNASSHDVYFGTASSPPFIGNQSGATYNPGTTSLGTTYFWRIDEKNTSGTTAGTVWSYTTTANQPTIVTIQRGTNGTVRDSYLRKNGDPPEAAGADAVNGGIVFGSGTRYYPDAGQPSGKAPRHNLIWFDVSGIPAGATINSATFGTFLTSVSGPAITGYKLSRLKAGKDWIEGVGATTATANPGESTWASQKHDHNPAWDAAGATGANDIDMATTISWDKAAGVSETITLDVKTWVNDWVNNGVQNNGMLMWGGTGPGGANNYFWLVTSDDTATPALRPYLSINYTPPAPLPGQASNPSPANGATLVPVASTLSWTAGSNATSHDVRFGTANPPPFVINQAGTTYNPGTLTAGTPYFWRIDEKNGSGTTTGVVWSFTTLPNRTITQWRSIRSHTGIGNVALVLNAAATGNGAAPAGPTVETRGTSGLGIGIQKIQVVFDGAVTLANAANVSVTGYTTTYPGGVATMGGLVNYTPAVSMSSSTTMDLLFSAGQLPDQSCYLVTIGLGTIAENLIGDRDCYVRALNGDANQSGMLTGSDVLLTKNKSTSGAIVDNAANAGNAIYDYNLSGAIDTADVLYCKTQFNTQTYTRAALCP